MIFRYLIVFSLFLALAAKAEEKAKAAAFAWQSTDPIQPPDFRKYFPDDPEGGKRLDFVISNNYREIKDPRELLEIARRGFRNMKRRRTMLFSNIGWKYISSVKEQNPQAIELMYHASDSPDKSDCYDAVYYGLSVVKPKTPAILKTLADIAMGTDEPNTIRRIAWGTKDQQKELLEYLKPYLASKEDKIRKHAEALEEIFSGKLSPGEYWVQNRRAEIEPLFGNRMEEFREQLTNGDSVKRREVINIIGKNHLGLLIKDHAAWLNAYAAAAEDPDPWVRMWVAKTVGGTYVWNAKEVNPVAVELLLKLANDGNREVRYDAFYHGLNRLPKDHPAQARAAKALEASRDRYFEEIRQALLQAVRDGKFKEVDKFLEQIKPRDRAKYQPEVREKAQALYDEIAKELSEARKRSKNVSSPSK